MLRDRRNRRGQKKEGKALITQRDREVKILNNFKAKNTKRKNSTLRSDHHKNRNLGDPEKKKSCHQRLLLFKKGGKRRNGSRIVIII